MARWLNLGGAAAAALVLCMLTVRAQEADPEPAPDAEASREEWDEHAAEAAEHAAAAAEAAAERVAEQAERMAQRAAEQAEAAADQAAAAAEQAAEHAAAQVQLAVEQAAEHSADIHIQADPFGAGAGPVYGEGPKDFFLRDAFKWGGKWERRAADPEAVKLLEMDRKLGRQIAELAAKYKAIDDDDERQEVAEELAARVTDQFTVRQQMRERELGELEEQVKKLRALQDKRASQIKQIVGDRVQQLLREADGLGWGDGGGEFGAGEGGKTLDLAFGVEAPVRIAEPAQPGVPPKPVKRLIIRGPDVDVTPPAIEAPAPRK